MFLITGRESLGEMTVVRERNLRVRDVLVPVVAVVVASFIESVPVGICVTCAVALALVAFITQHKQTQEDGGVVVLEIASQSLAIRRRWVREVEIPWQDVGAMRLSRGRKGSVNLDIRVAEPERYLGRFMRLNLSMSRYQISVRVSGLELSPKEIASTIEEAQKLFLKNPPLQKNGSSNIFMKAC
jgi:hypothetical protein